MHAWVQLASCQLMGLVFAGCDQDEVAHSLATSAEEGGACSRNKRRRLERHCLVDMSTVSGSIDEGHMTSSLQVKLLAKSFLTILRAPVLGSELANQVC